MQNEDVLIVSGSYRVKCLHYHPAEVGDVHVALQTPLYAGLPCLKLQISTLLSTILSTATAGS